MVRYPDWCCQHCGEPLRTCLNCIQLERMEREEESADDAEIEGERAVATTKQLQTVGHWKVTGVCLL